MEKLVETIARYLVDNPDEITVQGIGEDDRNEEVLQLSVSSDDMGKVIGKQGRIASFQRGNGRSSQRFRRAGGIRHHHEGC